MAGDDDGPVSGTIAWLDLSTDDVGVARRFYGALLGWTYTVEETPVGRYHVAQLGDRDIAGLMAMGPDAPETHPKRPRRCGRSSSRSHGSRTRSPRRLRRVERSCSRPWTSPAARASPVWPTRPARCSR